GVARAVLRPAVHAQPLPSLEGGRRPADAGATRGRSARRRPDPGAAAGSEGVAEAGARDLPEAVVRGRTAPEPPLPAERPLRGGDAPARLRVRCPGPRHVPVVAWHGSGACSGGGRARSISSCESRSGVRP